MTGLNTQDIIERLHAVDTPALVVDIEVALANARKIAAACASRGLRWRPHIKGLKTPNLLHLLAREGAHGFTCSKLGEAEVLVAHGFDDILIANQIVGALKIDRLMRLAETGAKLIVAVDNLANAIELGKAAAGKGLVIPVVIEVEIGMRRSGVVPAYAVVLAQRIVQTTGLTLAGVMAWEGHAARIGVPEQKQQAVRDALAILTDTAAAIRAEGMPVEIVSCSGSGTYRLATHAPGITEIQAGGGVLHDVAYETLYGIDHDFALFLLATVTSRPTATRIVCDAGKKSLSIDSAMPRPLGLGELRELRFSAEHGIVELRSPAAAPAVGNRVLFVVGYGDMTVHLHDELVAVTRDSVDVWSIAARGRSR